MTRASEIVEQIDLATAEGWNLRAMLLRGLAGKHIRDRGNADVAACVEAEALGLIETSFHVSLTDLGREVAEILRPKPWSVPDQLWLYDSDNWPAAKFEGSALARRVAELLTADDMRAATNYKDGDTP
jgi:hypothetical protein